MHMMYTSYKLIIFKVTYFAVPKPLSTIFQKSFLLLTWDRHIDILEDKTMSRHQQSLFPRLRCIRSSVHPSLVTPVLTAIMEGGAPSYSVA